jgi:hypothetical protein
VCKKRNASLRQYQFSRGRDAQAVALFAVLNPNFAAAGEQLFRLDESGLVASG